MRTPREIRCILLLLLPVALCAVVLIGLRAAAAAPDNEPAQAPRAPAEVDRALLDQLRWSFNVQTIGTVYGKRRSDLLYTGEPLMVDVWLSNRTKAEVKLLRTFDAVVAASGWRLDRIIDGKAVAAQARVEGMRSDKLVKIATLPPEKGAQLWVRLTDIKEPGKYRLRFAPPWGRVMEQWEEFELAVPTTKQETMEMHRHKALRLRWAGKPDEAERELRALLKMNPNSADAYVEIATLREQQQRFAEAAKYMEKAISLIETGADEFDNTP